MNELNEINYSGGLAFHQYNEPLLEFDYLCKCIECAKKINPNCRLELYTNGDLLTKSKLKKLKKLGINRLVVTCHFDPGEKWSTELAYIKVKSMMQKLSIHSKIEISDDIVQRKETKLLEFMYKLKEFGYKGLKKYPFKLQIRAVNFWNNGSSRMGVIKNDYHEQKEKDSSYYCYALLHGIHISYEGNVFMCCDCCENTKEATNYFVGSVYDKTIYDLFTDKNKLIQDYILGREKRICIDCYWNQ